MQDRTCGPLIKSQRSGAALPAAPIYTALRTVRMVMDSGGGLADEVSEEAQGPSLRQLPCWTSFGTSVWRNQRREATAAFLDWSERACILVS